VRTGKSGEESVAFVAGLAKFEVVDALPLALVVVGAGAAFEVGEMVEEQVIDQVFAATGAAGHQPVDVAVKVGGDHREVIVEGHDFHLA
jgi:hypothetical protein